GHGMRGCLVLSVVAFGAAGWVAGAPVTAPPPAAPAQPEAQAFAQQLFGVVAQVTEQYVRPVERTEVLHAALSGLYEAARLPVPQKRRAAVEKATAEGEVVDLIRRAREDVGNAEALQGHNPLVVCCQAMVRVLDPHCGIITGEEQRRTLGLGNE